MHMNSYRFSIAWPRIQPEGRGAANAAGLDYYRRLVDALLAAGIRPFPTLYHWDLPQALEDRGGWPARDTAARFADYAHLVVRALGDRVADWMLFNEPAIFTLFGYGQGIHAPGVRDRTALLRATHVVALAQGESFRAVQAGAPRPPRRQRLLDVADASPAAAPPPTPRRPSACTAGSTTGSCAPRCAASTRPASSRACPPSSTCARATWRASRRRSTSSASTSTRACSCTRDSTGPPRPRRALARASAAPRARRPTSAGRSGPTRSTTR